MELKLFLILMLSWNLHITYSEYCKEKNFSILDCGKLTEDGVIWSKVTNGRRVNIFTNHKGKVTEHSKNFSRYRSKGNSLIISKVLHSDAGRFFCNGNTVDLSVVTGRIPGPCPTASTERLTTEDTYGLSKAERVLRFGGAALAGLAFLLATVAAGRAIVLRAWQAGTDSVLCNSH